jgi:hypothetical protein
MCACVFTCVCVCACAIVCGCVSAKGCKEDKGGRMRRFQCACVHVRIVCVCLCLCLLPSSSGLVFSCQQHFSMPASIFGFGRKALVISVNQCWKYAYFSYNIDGAKAVKRI